MSADRSGHQDRAIYAPPLGRLDLTLEAAHRFLDMLEQTAPLPDELDKAVRHVLWSYNVAGGLRPGSFVQSILEACGRADPENLRRLAWGFPLLAQLCWTIQRVPGASDRMAALVAPVGGGAG